jgi:hypothetical protein
LIYDEFRNQDVECHHPVAMAALHTQQENVCGTGSGSDRMRASTLIYDEFRNQDVECHHPVATAPGSARQQEIFHLIETGTRCSSLPLCPGV